MHASTQTSGRSPLQVHSPLSLFGIVFTHTRTSAKGYHAQSSKPPRWSRTLDRSVFLPSKLHILLPAAVVTTRVLGLAGDVCRAWSRACLRGCSERASPRPCCKLSTECIHKSASSRACTFTTPGSRTASPPSSAPAASTGDPEARCDGVVL